MARFELRFKASVSKDLRGVPAADLRRILERIEALRADPRPPGCQKLGGSELYRIRQGLWRIVYSIDEGTVIVEVIRIGHRRDVYRG